MICSLPGRQAKKKSLLPGREHILPFRHKYTYEVKEKIAAGGDPASIPAEGHFLRMFLLLYRITTPYTSLTPSSARMVSVPLSQVKGHASGCTRL